MRLRALRMLNFRQHADTSIEFDTGITGLIGPNGTGKTTVLEAIAWALYGQEAARGRRETIRFLRADPKAPVRVELDFELGSHCYRIVRGLTTAELYLDGGAQPIANSITSVGEHVHRRLGMTRAEFFNTYFTGQKELGVMAALGPTERAQFLSRVIGYERLRDAQARARDRRRDLAAEVTGMQHALANRDRVEQEVSDSNRWLAEATEALEHACAAHARSTAALARVEPEFARARAAREAWTAATQAYHDAMRDLALCDTECETATATIAEAERAAADLTVLAGRLAHLSVLEAEADRLDALARGEGRRQQITGALPQVEQQIMQLAERRVRLEATASREEVLTREIDTARAAAQEADRAFDRAQGDWKTDLAEAQAKRHALREHYNDVKAQRERIIAAGENGICPTCQRPLDTHFRTVLDSLNERMDALLVDGRYFKARIAELNSRPAALVAAELQRTDARSQVTRLEAELSVVATGRAELHRITREMEAREREAAGLRAELAALPTGFDAERRGQVMRELAEIRALEMHASRLRVLMDRGVAARAALAKAQIARDAARVRSTEFEARRAELEHDSERFDALQIAFERARSEVTAAEISVARAQEKQVHAVNALARARAAQEELAAQEARARELICERRLHDELDGTYGDLRNELNAALRPELSRIASQFLADLTDGRYSELDLDEQYNLVIVEDGVPKPVISGGEEDLANLVLRLAISEMIADRAGQPFSLLILDEVFGSLDDVRRQNVVALLRRLRDRFEQVILITHIESIRDGCDQVLTVRYDGATGAAAVQQAVEAPLPDLDVRELASA
jgi:exonuclease SbcC